MIDRLLLETKSNIYINSISEFIVQPSIKDISYILQGENKFFEILNDLCRTIIDIDYLQKNNNLTSEQINILKQITSFDYLLGLIAKDIYFFIKIKLLFKLFFPEHICSLKYNTDNNEKIIKTFFEFEPKENSSRKKFIIDNNNYEEIVEIIKNICCITIDKNSSEEEFNPANEQAKRIAETIKANRKKIQEIKKNQNNSKYFLANMINLLRGTGKFDNETLINMSIFQLQQTFKRNGLFEEKQEQILYKVNGFEIKEFIDWTKDIE